MALNFPTSPALNEIYDRWQWNGDRWVAAPAPPATAYLPLHGGTMSGPILQPVPPATAAAVPNRAYVDEAIATQALYQGVWTAATNDPDLIATATHRDGFMWLVTTPDPNLPFTVTATGIPGLSGNEVHNGDRVIWSVAAAEFQIVPGGGLTMTQGDARYLQLLGGTMTGDIVLDGDAAANLNPVPLQQVHEILADYPLKTEALIKGVPGTYTQVAGTPANDFEFNDFQTFLNEKINNHWFDDLVRIDLTADVNQQIIIENIASSRVPHIDTAIAIYSDYQLATNLYIRNFRGGPLALHCYAAVATTLIHAVDGYSLMLSGYHKDAPGGTADGDPVVYCSGTLTVGACPRTLVGQVASDNISIPNFATAMGTLVYLKNAAAAQVHVGSLSGLGSVIIPATAAAPNLVIDAISITGQVTDNRPANPLDTFQRNPPTVIYSTPGSYVWTCQRTGRYQIMAAGPGGGGAAWVGDGSSSARYATGSSGGVAQGILRIAAGQILQISVPRGGAAAGSWLSTRSPVFGTQQSSATTVSWPYLNADDGSGPIAGLDARYWYMYANFGVDGGYMNALANGFGDAPNISGNSGFNGSTSALNAQTAGRQITGTSWAGPVQLTSGHGGNMLSDGGAGSALIAYVGP